MNAHVELGSKFGRLTVLRRGPNYKHGMAQFFCKCDCGNECLAISSSLRRGMKKSCGCLQKNPEHLKHEIKHGMARKGKVIPEWNIWSTMKQRCFNPNNGSYANYGARGIKVCDRWLNSFENFYTDMGPRPSSHHTVERKDNNGNYEPDNCVWDTRTIQANNTRKNHLITFNGKTQTLAQWARELELPISNIAARVQMKWSPEKIFSTPIRYVKNPRVPITDFHIERVRELSGTMGSRAIAEEVGIGRASVIRIQKRL